MLFEIWIRRATYDELLAVVQAESQADAERMQGEMGLAGADLVEVAIGDLRGLRRLEKVYQKNQEAV